MFQKRKSGGHHHKHKAKSRGEKSRKSPKPKGGHHHKKHHGHRRGSGTSLALAMAEGKLYAQRFGLPSNWDGGAFGAFVAGKHTEAKELQELASAERAGKLNEFVAQRRMPTHEVRKAEPKKSIFAIVGLPDPMQPNASHPGGGIFDQFTKMLGGGGNPLGGVFGGGNPMTKLFSDPLSLIPGIPKLPSPQQTEQLLGPLLQGGAQPGVPAGIGADGSLVGGAGESLEGLEAIPPVP